jgi:regulator of CtrA degradation
MTGHKQFEQFVERTYGETFQLLEEALEYNSDGLKQDVGDLPRGEGLKVAGEKMRLTTRLSEIMAWLLVHKALVRGEITLEQTQSKPCHLSAADVCIHEGRGGKKACPKLGGMLDRSRDLYGRVVKMDQMATRLYANIA